MSAETTNPAEPDELRSHAGFLRRVARGLLFDRAGADDVVQEAWMAALRARPEGRPARTWLGGAVRRLALNRRREEARRARREVAAARPEAQPSTVDVAARIELMQRVTAAVETLDEPYRTAVVLRFFDALPPREIARREGVPVNTVRSRLRRGLERLRRELDGDGKRDRTAFLAALVPLAVPLPPPWVLAVERAAETVAEALPGTSGVVLMSTKAKLSIAGVLFLSALFVTWQLVDVGAVEAEPSASTRVAESTGIADAALAAEEQAAEPAAVVAASEVPEAPTRAAATGSASAGSWVVRGRAWLGRKAGYPRARVRLRLWQGYEQDAEPEVHEVVANEEGRFEWALEPPAGTVRVAASVLGDELVSYGDEELVVRGSDPPSLSISVYPLDSDVTGVVRDEEGVAIEGASVKCFEQVVQTDGQGRYRLRAPSLFSSGMLYAWAEEHAEKRVNFTAAAAGGAAQADIVLRRSFRVYGRVLDEETGLAVEGAKVGTFFTNATHTRTDAAGRYELTHLDPGRPRHMVWVRAEGYVVVSENVVPDARTGVEQDYALDRGARVTGVIVDLAGEPVPATELFVGFSPNAWNRVDAVSRDDGSFALSSVERGDQVLWVQREGYAPVQRRLTVPEDGGLLDVGRIVLGPGGSIAGRVVDPAGEPLPGIYVSARYLGEYIDSRAKTDAEGRFELEDLPAAEMGLELYATGFVRLEQDVATGTTDLELVMCRAGRIAGRVVDARTGEPIEVFRIRFVQPRVEDGDIRVGSYGATWSREGQAFSNPEGYWDTKRENLEPGAVIGIEASARGYAPTTAWRVQVSTDPDPDALVLQLAPGVTVAGRVVAAETGEPVADALVKRYTDDHPLRSYDSDDVHGRMQTRTDANGRFVFENVPPGDMHLAVTHADWLPISDGPFEVPAEGAVGERWIELGEGSALYGRMLGPDGEPMAGEEVRLHLRRVLHDDRRAGGGAASQATSNPGIDERIEADAEGRFRFENLPPGLYQLGHMVHRDGLGVYGLSLQVRIEAGEDREVDLAPMGSCTVEGTIECEHELPDGLTVSVMLIRDVNEPQEEPVRQLARGTFTKDGRFTVRGLEPGEYNVSVHHLRHPSKVAFNGFERVQVQEGAPTRVNIPVKRVNL